MKAASLFMALLGTSFAGGSAYLANEYIDSRTTMATAQQDPAAEIVQVLVASQDIAFGQEIEAGMLTTRAWPRDALPEGAFTDYTLLLPQGEDEGRRARRAISEGTPILMSQVSEFGEKVTIVQTLSEDGRAVAISVNARTSAGGFVTPGDYVDVILTQGAGESLRAVTILQNIRVIAVDQDANEETDTPGIARTVTVDVTPRQGQILALAQQAGTLSLMLRRLGVDPDEPMQSLRLSDVLLEESPVPEAEIEVVQTRTITVRRGLEAQEVRTVGVQAPPAAETE